MAKLLLSACLAGRPVRYDGASKPQRHDELQSLMDANRVVVFCPETAGGLSVPREAAEIQGGSGTDVLDGIARIITASGQDVTKQFVDGAKHALTICRRENVSVAIMTEKSPSCGSNYTYDGSFSRTLQTDSGTTAALLQRNGIHVFNEHQIDQAIGLFNSITDKDDE